MYVCMYAAAQTIRLGANCLRTARHIIYILLYNIHFNVSVCKDTKIKRKPKRKRKLFLFMFLFAYHELLKPFLSDWQEEIMA